MGSGASERGIVLIVDDDKSWCFVMAKLFSSAGYTAMTAGTCGEGLRLADSCRPVCILLDFHMPDGDGGMVCSAVRGSTALRKTPIVIVSADPAEELNAYSLYHADGFILKGASLEKILAVVQSVLRRVDMERGCLEKGDLKLDPEGYRVFRNGRPVLTLTLEQFRLLSLLVEAGPDPVGEAEICRCVLNSAHTPEKTEAIRSLVYRLRQGLGLRLACRIKNLSGLGWAYVQPRVKAGSAPAPD